MAYVSGRSYCTIRRGIPGLQDDPNWIIRKAYFPQARHVHGSSWSKMIGKAEHWTRNFSLRWSCSRECPGEFRTGVGFRSQVLGDFRLWSPVHVRHLPIRFLSRWFERLRPLNGQKLKAGYQKMTSNDAVMRYIFEAGIIACWLGPSLSSPEAGNWGTRASRKFYILATWWDFSLAEYFFFFFQNFIFGSFVFCILGLKGGGVDAGVAGGRWTGDPPSRDVPTGFPVPTGTGNGVKKRNRTWERNSIPELKKRIFFLFSTRPERRRRVFSSSVPN